MTYHTNKSFRLSCVFIIVLILLILLLIAGVVIAVFAFHDSASSNKCPLYGQYGANQEWHEQIIYMMMLDRFQNGDPTNDRAGFARCFDPSRPRWYHGGDFKGIQQRIAYLKHLGVTTVWPTPIYEQTRSISPSGCPYHGYSANFDLPASNKIEPKLGNASAFTNLLNALHQNGMKYMIDMVINHAGVWAPLVSKRPSWFHPLNGWCQPPIDGILQCKSPNESWPDFARTCESNSHPSMIYCPLYDLPDFAQEVKEASDYLVQTSLNFLTQFSIDAIRMDTARHVEAGYFKNTWIPAMRQARNNLFMVGESYYDDYRIPEVILQPYIRAGFDSMFNFPLRSAMEEVFIRGGNVEIIRNTISDTISTFGIDRALMMTNFLGNHDMPRFLRKLAIQFGSIYNYTVVDKIRHQYHMALLTLFTIPGIPQFYYGDELGMMGGNSTSDDSQYRWDMPEWGWTEYGRRAQSRNIIPGYLPNPQATFIMVKSVMALRSTNPALMHGYYAELFNSAQRSTFAFFRSYQGNRVVVIINSSSRNTGLITIPIRSIGDVHSDDKSALKDGSVFTEIAQMGAPRTLTVNHGGFLVNIPSNVVAVYKNQ